MYICFVTCLVYTPCIVINFEFFGWLLASFECSNWKWQVHSQILIKFERMNVNAGDDRSAKGFIVEQLLQLLNNKDISENFFLGACQLLHKPNNAEKIAPSSFVAATTESSPMLPTTTNTLNNDVSTSESGSKRSFTEVSLPEVKLQKKKVRHYIKKY